MPLSDVAIKAAKPREREFKLTDAGGLYLLVKPNGARLWNLAFRYDGRQKKLAIGPYPTIDLKAARAAREEAKRKLEQGVDPALQKQVDKQQRAAAAAETWKVVAEEWLEKLRQEGRAAVTVEREELLLRHSYPHIGKRPLVDLEAPDLLVVLRKVAARGTLNSAHRLRGTMSRVFRYAIATGRAKRDVAADLKGALPAVQGGHRAAVTDPKAVGGLVRAINAFEGYRPIGLGLRILLLTFVRPTELRAAPWTELDLDAAEWRIPPERMKKKRPHIVPLSRQAVVAFRELQEVTGDGELMFPSIRTAARPISENTWNVALRRLGYANDEVCAHGFRRTASTTLNEQGWNSDWVERQLAHVEENKVRGAYNAAEWLADRRRMMQHWADWLDRMAIDEEDLIG